ncbi:MAG: Gmad2 immunoglobulin-like domain-containing protein [Patescibacteria group bacterium]
MTKIIRIIISLVIILALGWMGFIIWQQFETSDNLNNNSPIVNNSPVDVDQEVENLIKVVKPQKQQLVASPLQVTGEARGTWFFEASFPIRLLDDQGNILAQGIAQAQSDWMTENFVPFVASLTFTKPSSDAGVLVLQKDNPSGLPEYDAQINIPVLFGEDNQLLTKPCIITGCSKQICADEEVITTCDFKPEYVCYTRAVCERQEDNQCGWTKTPDLETCLDEFKEQ